MVKSVCCVTAGGALHGDAAEQGRGDRDARLVLRLVRLQLPGTADGQPAELRVHQQLRLSATDSRQ